jgi:DtxR family Mn-dependent transcriptional regulator
MPAAADRPLTECTAGERFRVARVVDQSPEFLRYLSQTGLEIGTQGSLVGVDSARNVMTIDIAGRSKTIACDAAAKLMVR